MKKFCQLFALIIVAMVCFPDVAHSQDRNLSRMGRATTPQPFDEINQPRENAAPSTGYYFMDWNCESPGASGPTKWKTSALPNGATIGLLPTSFEPHLWYRIYSGPRQVPVNEREAGYDPVKNLIIPPAGGTPREGYRYFRNPSQYLRYLDPMYNVVLSEGDVTSNGAAGIDSVRFAIAGPIPIGFAFYMNGLRYDSFYVSPRGIIALSNRRYLYDSEGRRAVPPNKTDCYDPMSADWYFPGSTPQGRPRKATGIASTDSLIEDTPDNYGFVNIACGGDPSSYKAGIRNFYLNGDGVGPNNTPPTQNPTINRRLTAVYNGNLVHAGGAFITPLEGPFFLPQYNEALGRSDDRGQVYYKRSITADKLIIYFKNLQLDPGPYRITNGSTIFTYGPILNGRPGVGLGNVVSVSCQVELNRLDSSISFRYGEWEGTAYLIGGTAYDLVSEPNEVIQPWASIAVGGYARHRSYNTKDPASYERPESAPWGGQYIQYTQDFNGIGDGIIDQGGQPVRIEQWLPEKLPKERTTKFKQWKNSLRLVDVQYFTMAKQSGATAFTDPVITNDVQDVYNPFELFAGHPQLGAMQPVGLIQNLTNDIQAPSGVNFVEQDFQFQARLLIRNKVTERYVYNRFSSISNECLRDFENSNFDCNLGDENINVRYVPVTKDPQNNYIVGTPISLDDMNNANVNGIPPYKFVQVRFPVYRPIESISDAIGIMELMAITEPVNPNTMVVIGDDWPFDDTSRIDFWVINRLASFRCNGEFHTMRSGVVPNVQQWVHSKFNAALQCVSVEGSFTDQTSYNPLPPIEYTNSLNTNNPNSINSPMYRLTWNRNGGGGQFEVVPSKITSFPIDLRNRNGSILTLATQRATAETTNLGRGFSDDALVGPEARVVFLDPYDRRWHGPENNGSFISNTSGKVNTIFGSTQEQIPEFDYLAVEYLRPSSDGIRNITNTGSFNIKNDAYNKADASTNNNNDRWRHHPTWVNRQEGTGNNVVQNAPALAVFGGGGYFVGWAFANGRTYNPVNWNGGVTGLGDPNAGGGVVVVNREVAISQRECTTQLGYRARQLVVGGLMPNPYDVGFDFEFYRYSVVIPDFFMEKEPDYGQNFRFRIKMIEPCDFNGTGSRKNLTGETDPTKVNPIDEGTDIFFIDNIAIMFPDMLTDLEAQVVKIIWPYTSIPATQAVNLDVIGRISNMGTSDAPPFMVKIRAHRNDVNITEPAENAIWCQTTSVSQLAKGQSTEVTINGFSPRNFCTTPQGSYLFTLILTIEHASAFGDLYARNDTIKSTFIVNLGDNIAYVKDPMNEVPTFAGVPGKGLNTGGASFGGAVLRREPTEPYPLTTKALILGAEGGIHNGRYFNFWSGFGNYGWLEYVCGGNLNDILLGYPSHDYISGQIAMKFKLNTVDELKGFRVSFGSANKAFDDIAFHVYTDNNGVPNTNPISSPMLPLYGRRLQAKSPTGQETLKKPEEFVDYYLPNSLPLGAGTYWIAIEQLGQTGLELAASGNSMGMKTMLVSFENSNLLALGTGEVGEIGLLGGNGIQLMVDKRFRVPTTNQTYGRVYVNNNIFAYRNVNENWQQFMPTNGQVAYPHLNHIGMLHRGTASLRNNYRTFTRGTWSPILSPIFGIGTIDSVNAKNPCPDDMPSGPGTTAIEVSSFNGYTRNGLIELAWETVSEINNHSFIVERTELNNENWTEIGVVAGAGNSMTSQVYSMQDDDVVPGTTYRYRLYSLSWDGVISCQNNNVITVEFEDNRAISLSNSPNPFNIETNIIVYVPTAQKVTLEVLDIFGSVVKTLAVNETLRGEHSFVWDGRDENGRKVADGHYLYRLIAGETIITKKLSFISK